MKPIYFFLLSLLLLSGCELPVEDLNQLPDSNIPHENSGSITYQFGPKAVSGDTIVVYGGVVLNIILRSDTLKATQIEINFLNKEYSYSPPIAGFSYQFGNLKDGFYPLSITVTYRLNDNSIGAQNNLALKKITKNLTLRVFNLLPFTQKIYEPVFDSGYALIRWNSYQEPNFVRYEFFDNQNSMYGTGTPTDTTFEDFTFNGSGAYRYVIYAGNRVLYKPFTIRDTSSIRFLSAEFKANLTIELSWNRYRHYKNTDEIQVEYSTDGLTWKSFMTLPKENTSVVFLSTIKSAKYRISYMRTGYYGGRIISTQPSHNFEFGYEEHGIEAESLVWLPHSEKIISTTRHNTFFLEKTGNLSSQSTDYFIFSNDRTKIISVSNTLNKFSVLDPLTLSPIKNFNLIDVFPSNFQINSGILTDNGKLFLTLDKVVSPTTFAYWEIGIWNLTLSGISFIAKTGREENGYDGIRYEVTDATVDGEQFKLEGWYQLNGLNQIVVAPTHGTNLVSQLVPPEFEKDPLTGDTYKTEEVILNGLSYQKVTLINPSKPDEPFTFITLNSPIKIINHILYVGTKRVQLP